MYQVFGRVSEWFKESVLKTDDVERHRGFESYLFRHIKCPERLEISSFGIFFNAILMQLRYIVCIFL